MAIQRTKASADNLENHPGGTEEFASKRERVTKDVSDNTIQPGWSADKRPARTNGVNVVRFKVPDDGEEVIVKFLDDRPFAPIFQHWVLVEGGQRRAFTCGGAQGCPMCDRGDKPKSSDWFNVVELGEEPVLKVWYATADPAAAIRDKAETKRYSPINKPNQYFAISKKKGTNGFNTYSVDVIREDELESEWGVKPLTESQLEEFRKNAYNGDLVKIHTNAELAEAARKYLDE